MANHQNSVPTTSGDFDKMYGSVLHWAWRDVRIPKELKQLAAKCKPESSLELGCGAGLFTSFMADQGIKATGVDFSKVAIEKSKKRIIGKGNQPEYIVGDVTDLKTLKEPFAVAFDVGCFHCLDDIGQQKYASELYRLLKPDSILLIWALNNSPSDIKLTADYMAEIFKNGFQLIGNKFSRRRIASSRWYWLMKNKEITKVNKQ